MPRDPFQLNGYTRYNETVYLVLFVMQNINLTINACYIILFVGLFQIQKNVSMLKPKMENFVLSLLRIGWADQDQSVVVAYREFLVNLVTAQGYYTKPVVKVSIKCQYFMLRHSLPNIKCILLYILIISKLFK